MSPSDPLPSPSPPQSSAPTVDELCGEAMRFQLAGETSRAQALYDEALQREPGHPVANHCLGMLRVQARRPVEALPPLLIALESSPQTAEYWYGYLEALLLAQRFDEATATLSLGKQHGLTGAWLENFEGRLASRMVKPPTTSKAASAPPVHPTPAPSRAERRRETAEIQSLENGLLALIKQRRFADALGAARTLTERFPDRGLGWKAMGAMLWANGDKTESVSALQRAAQLLGDDSEAQSNLAATLIKVGRYDEAEECLQRMLRRDPDSAAVHNHFSNLYQLQGRYVEGEASVRRALASLSADPRSDDKQIHSSLLFMLSHNPGIDADTLFAEHRRVGSLYEHGLRTTWPQHTNTRDPDRVLQVAFVSGDFFNHAVAHFVEPLLSQFRLIPGFELHAYYTHSAEDEVTRRIRGSVAHWTAAHEMPAKELAKRILKDRIDVLIDVSGHTSQNRLRTFAAKPAPVQVSWLGYVGTTGLHAMDYYMTDRHFLPKEQFEAYFTEKLVYLPAAAPFLPHEAGPPVNDLPAKATGRFSFGSFNRLGKINTATIALWSRLLRALPETRFVIGGIPPGTLRRKLADELAAQGVGTDRLTFHERCTMDEFLALHHGVDLCLDTQPWAGGTTTNHSLWMGVPTLTVIGTTPASRLSAALLEQVGLDVFIAHDDDEFVAKGIYWAGHLDELARYRAVLRQRCLESTVRQPDVIAAAIGRALRLMWKRWCAGLPPTSLDVSEI